MDSASTLPASFIAKHAPDPSRAIAGSPAGFGQEVVPHIFSVAGRVGVFNHAYPWYDEALRDSRENARIMRTECGIMECLEARQRGTALLRWHIEPRQQDEAGKDLAKKVTDILERTWQFLELRRNLLEALWYGRYMTVHRMAVDKSRGKWRQYIQSWTPRHGDKIAFRYDDGSGRYMPNQVGLRITAAEHGLDRKQIEYTSQWGRVYWLRQYERDRVAVHRHLIEDTDFDDPRGLGRVNGVGIRDRIYWTWYAMQETLANALNFIERNAHGIEVWRYPANNPQAKAETIEAAQNRSNKAIVLVPVMPGEQADMYDVQVIEPGFSGLEALMQIIQGFFAHKIKRYILGQTLTSEAEATGLGSGVADAHMATYADIVLFDSIKLAETLTTDLVRPIQLFNFRDSHEYELILKIDTESEDMASKLEAWERAYNMGAKLPEADVLSMIGARMPDEGDKVLENPQFSQAMQQGMSQWGSDPGPWKPDSTSTFGPIGSAANGSLIDLNSRNSPNRYSAESQRPAENPSDAQREAGNYRKGHIRLHGLDLSIENLKGTRRRPEWPELAAHYGYIRRTEGRDGDHVDCFLGECQDCEIAFVLDQETAGGRFDEHKVFLGFQSQSDALKAYRDSYTPGWRVGPMTALTIDQLKEWLAKGDQTKRLAPQVSKYALKPSKGQQEFKWITIGGSPGSRGEHEGGTHVKVDSAGNIGAGPKALEGKNLNSLDKDVAATDRDEREDSDPPAKEASEQSKVKLVDVKDEKAVNDIIDTIRRYDPDLAELATHIQGGTLPEGVKANAIADTKSGKIWLPNGETPEASTLVHELTHLKQKRDGRIPEGGRDAMSPDEFNDIEAEAHQAAKKFREWSSTQESPDKDSGAAGSDDTSGQDSPPKGGQAAAPGGGARDGQSFNPEEHGGYKPLLEIANRLRSGDMSLEEYREAFERYAGNQDAFVADLQSRFNAKQLKNIAGNLGEWSANSNTKQQNAESTYKKLLLHAFHVGDGAFSYGGGMSTDWKSAYVNALRDHVNSQTEESLRDVADKSAEAVKKRQEATKAADKALSNPETLDEFRDYSKQSARAGEDDPFWKLPPEKRAAWDKAEAEERRKERDAKREKQNTVERLQKDAPSGFDITKNFHSKRGIDIYTASPTERVDRDGFMEMKAKAKQLGGWYYKAFGGTPGGFHFPTEEGAKKFASLINGNADASSEAGTRESERNATVSDRLRGLADSMESDAQSAISAPRQTNTARRADMAASAIGAANATIARAETMRKIADAVERGEADLLQGVSARTHVEQLDSMLKRAKWDYLHKSTRGVSHADTPSEFRYGNYESRPFEPEMIDAVDYPYPGFHGDFMRDIESALKGKRGIKHDVDILRSAKARSKSPYVRLDRPEQWDALKNVMGKLKQYSDRDYKRLHENLDANSASFRRLQRMGIENGHELREALRQYHGLRAKAKEEDPVSKAERALVGQKIPGFFPTPPRVSDELLSAADIKPGHSVLEPSAGKGDLIDAIKLHQPDASVRGIEFNRQLGGVLSAKGHDVEFGDFLDHQGQYDRIVMNPPFEKGQDIAHVKHAFEQLKPGGRLVAVMSAGGGGKRDEFDSWLSDNGGESIDLPENSFNSSDSFRKTGVNTRMVVLDKPEVSKRAIRFATEFTKLLSTPMVVS